MKELEGRDEDEMAALLERLANWLIKEVPDGLCFLLVLGTKDRHGGTATNLPPERISDVLQRVADWARIDGIENN